MDSKEFVQIRRSLGKTQEQLSLLLCVSAKAIQSYEQGWRHIPTHIERQMFLFLSLKKFPDRRVRACWDIKNCPDGWRENCLVWELQARNFCWFINGTFCQGSKQKIWEKKIELCRECEVYKEVLGSTLQRETQGDLNHSL